MPEYKTQIIKLQNGEDLIANVIMNGKEHYILEEPMEFAIDTRNPNNAGLIMRHWLPVQLIKKNSIEIHSKDILSMMEPEDQFCEYYVNTVYKIKELLKAKEIISEMDDEELGNMINEFEELEQYGNTLH
jgi:hypothetical protein